MFRGCVEGTDIFLALFVDDGLIAAKSRQALDSIVKSLKNAFEITLGDERTFVGVQIERDRENKTLFFHQGAYKKRIIEKFRMSEAKATSILADPHVTLISSESNEENSAKVPYREAVNDS